MHGWKGILTGALALVFFETIVQPAASQRVGSGIGALANLATRFLDPAVPAIGSPPKQRSAGRGVGNAPSLPSFIPKIGGIPLSASIPQPTAAPAVGVLY